MLSARDSLRLVRLEPAPSASLEGIASGARALGLSQAAILLDLRGSSVPAGSRNVRIEADEGTLELPLASGPEPHADGALFRLPSLDPGLHASLERYLMRHRKADHIRICRDEDVATLGTESGFDHVRLPYEALPELRKSDVDLSTTILGKRLAAPILISCMTGGSALAKVINERLAVVAERHGLALGLGSQRALLKDSSLLDTYAVRHLAPNVLLFGNMGAVQLNLGVAAADLERVVAMVGADALFLHLNPLQEAVQPEGDTDFRGLRARIAEVAETLSVPVLLKEVGNGLSASVADLARTSRVAGVDVAGAGGTSWSRVEGHRAHDAAGRRTAERFGGFGHPTVASLLACRRILGDKLVFASGGVRHGLDVARAIALGAAVVGLARPFLLAASQSLEAADDLARAVIEELRIALFCGGCATLGALRRAGAVWDDGTPWGRQL